MMSDSFNSENTACPVCCATDIRVFIEIAQLPVHSNVIYPSYQEAVLTPQGDLQLGFCKICGHIFNMAFDPVLMQYNQTYENSLHFSPHFQEYAKSLAMRLIECHSLKAKNIIEIGCGKGDFLHLLCKLGNNHGVGFDRSYVRERIDSIDKNQITFIQDFYSERYSHYQADLICCRHVLEHIQTPRNFLTAIRRTIGSRLDTALYFEVPNVMFMLRDLSIWDLIYEHCAYFCKSSLAYLFHACNFQVKNLSGAFNDQFLGIDLQPVENLSLSKDEKYGDIQKLSNYVTAFGERYQDKVTEWRHKLEEIESVGQQAVLWGAGSKGVTFLNTLNIKDQIKYIVDINPHKHGMYVAGTGQKIVPPAFLKEYQPNTVIVMNEVYLEEIRQIVTEMGVSSQFIVA